MSSTWLWFLSFSIVICCQTANGAWETNEDVVDLTIAICQKPSNYDKGLPDRLIQMLTETVRKLKISENKTRLTIYEIGGPNQIHRLIDNSFDKDDIIKAINDIGNHFKSVHDTTYNEAAKGIRDLVDAKATDRIDVPKPVVIIWEYDPNSTNESTLKDAAGSNAKYGAGFVFLSNVRDSGDVHVIGVFPAIREKTFQVPGEVWDLDVVASLIADTIRERVKNCRFQQSTSTCYIDTGSQCVANALYETMYIDGTVERPPSEKLQWYCFKNGLTIPCSPDDCPTTTTTTTSTTTRPTTKITTTKKNGNATNVARKKPDETDSSMSWVMIGVAITIGLVVVAVTVFAVFWVCRRKKQRARREKARKKVAAPKKKSQFKVAKTNPHCKVVKIKSKSAAAEKNSKVPQWETPGDPEWSYSQPPSVSVSSPEEIRKQMLKESKAKK